MKYFTKALLLISTLFASIGITNAITYEEAYNNSSKKPVATLIYATWADSHENCIRSFRNTRKKLGKTFNFVELDIASKDTKFFNSKYQINTNLPYVIVQRERGKITRQVAKDCVMNESCLNSKLRSFIQ